MNSIPPALPAAPSSREDDQCVPEYETAPVALPAVAISRANRLGVRAAFARPAAPRAEKLGIASSSSQRAARLGIGSSLARRAERLGLAPDPIVDEQVEEQSA